MSNEQQQAQDEITQFTTAYLNHINEINTYLPRIRNITYDNNTNTTTVYGHTNFQELKVNGTNVTLQGHTHDIDDVLLSYEEEEMNNEEETVIITKTKPLSEVLDEKADVGHNHDSSYAPINHNHDSSYAPSSHSHAISDITNLQTTLNGKASLSHNHDSSYAPSSHTHTTTDITNWSTATSNFALTNAANTFTGNQTFNNYLYVYGTYIYHLVSGMGNGSNMYKYMGKSTSNGQGMRIRYYYNSTLASTFAQIGINGYPAINIYYHNVDVSYPLNVGGAITSTGTITGTNVKSDNETRLAAAETAIAGKAASSHTHTLSEISDYVAPTAYDDSNCAKLNAANVFTNLNTFRSTIEQLDSLPSGSYIYHFIGKSRTTNADAGQMYYYYHSTQSNRYIKHI